MDARLPPQGAEHFIQRPTPTWGGNLAQIDWDDIHYFVRASEKNSRDWSEVPEDIKNTFDRLGIPEAERNFLSGVGAQYESEVVYHQVREKLEKQGVIFTDMDTGLREYEDLVREYWATVIPPNDNKLAALNSAVWSGGSFVYVPDGRQGRDAAPGLLPDQHREHGPVRAHADHRRGGLGRALHRGLHGAGLFDRLAALGGGRDHRQAERPDPLHDGPELVPERLQPGHQARGRPRGRDDGVGRLQPGLEADDEVPVDLPARRAAHGEVLSIAFAGEGQHQDAGGKIFHVAPKTTSSIFSKSISKDGGRGTYRGLLEVAKGATESSSKVVCDALLLDEESRSDTYPTIRIGEDDVDVGHEATVSKIGEEQLFYLQSHGLERGGGLEDDRQRLHRADHQGAPDGVRGRDEPPDRAADGGIDWLAPRGASWARLVDRAAPRRRRARSGARASRPRRRRAGSSPTSRRLTSTPSARKRRPIHASRHRLESPAMVDLDEVRGLIERALPGAEVEVVDETGTGDHLRATVAAPQFRGWARSTSTGWSRRRSRSAWTMARSTLCP